VITRANSICVTSPLQKTVVI